MYIMFNRKGGTLRGSGHGSLMGNLRVQRNPKCVMSRMLMALRWSRDVGNDSRKGQSGLVVIVAQSLMGYQCRTIGSGPGWILGRVYCGLRWKCFRTQNSMNT